MYYNKQQLDRCSPKLLALLWKQDRIENAELSSLALEPVIAKIIRVAREEKHAFVYISAMCDMLFFEMTFNEVLKAVKYGDLFLREGREIFEEALPTDTSPGAFRQNYILCYETISSLYMNFPQISTKKMEQFFALYQKNMRLYGNEILFYKCRLKWEVICHNTEAAKKLCRIMEATPLNHQCYVCTFETVNHARILMGNLEGALIHCANIVSGNIPTEARASYETCECASAYAQYSNLFEECLFCERLEFLDRVLPLLHKEVLSNHGREDVCCTDALSDALYGNFERYEDYVKHACERLDEQKLYLPYEYMYACLMLMVYFRLLRRSGITTIAFPTENPIPLKADHAGQYSVSEIADYFEQIADEIGWKFEKSRVIFAYAKRKACFKALEEIHLTHFLRT